METVTRIKENWFNQRVSEKNYWGSAFFTSLIVTISCLYLVNFNNFQDLFPVSFELLFTQHQYYRAWTALLAHADFNHLLSNLFLFIPLSYFLMSYFGTWVFPFFGFIVAGLVNILTLFFYDPQVRLIGLSGLVYWMGAVSFTLYFLIDGPRKKSSRFATVLFLTLILFVPDKYNPEVSYLAHFFGFLLGIVSGVFLFSKNKNKFKTKEVVEVTVENFDEDLDSQKSVSDNLNEEHNHLP
ncbi:MAG: rhomboid family intramembrane serine protease [Bdellovibrionaceae bacterium]|nr:rhomboid family intramembrane serine protease [Pseudobdellovibrionaceae bacterium]NUM59877.1 rhomboid family intramembrane serine protease [Pseudobdellovibrionaceae bacterium]